MLGLTIFVLFAAIALLAPILFDESQLDVTKATGGVYENPSGQFWLGTDDSGRNVLALVAWGARISLLVGLCATVLAMVIGTAVGIASGHYRGLVAGVLNRLTDWFLVIPFLPLAIVLATVLGKSLLNIIIVIGVTSWPATARLIRAQTLSVEGRPYLERAKALGGSDLHQMTRHVLPNVMPLVLANTTLAVSISILSETTLSFLGLGDPTAVSWGTILDDAFASGAISAGAWWYLAAPGYLRGTGRSGLQSHRANARGHPRPARSPRMTLLEFDDVSITYQSRQGPVPAVRNVSLSVPLGQTVGIAGESGCGKTTLTSSVLRLLPKSAQVTGQIRLDGEDVMAMSFGQLRAVRWAQAAVVFQGAMHALNPVQRIETQLAEPILLHEDVGPKAAGTRVGELLEQVGLPASRARAYPHQLSGGQKQRVMIAMALACRPKLLIADEPTTALDVMVQAQVLDLLSSLVADLGLGVVFISHDLSVLAATCDRVAVMYAGRIVEQGSASDVFARPLHPYARALAAAFPRIGDRQFRYAPAGVPGDPPFPGDLPAGCPFHPRCPMAIDRCATSEPVLETYGDRDAACHRAGEVLV